MLRQIFRSISIRLLKFQKCKRNHYTHPLNDYLQLNEPINKVDPQKSRIYFYFSIKSIIVFQARFFKLPEIQLYRENKIPASLTFPLKFSQSICLCVKLINPVLFFAETTHGVGFNVDPSAAGP